MFKAVIQEVYKRVSRLTLLSSLVATGFCNPVADLVLIESSVFCKGFCLQDQDLAYGVSN